MQLKVYNLNTYGNRLNFIEVPAKIILRSRMCTIGEQFTEEYTCEKCPIGYYSFLPQTSPGQCQTCPQNAICPGENLLLPKQGYIRMHEHSAIFVRCFNNIACLEGTKEKPLNNCKEGFTGFMCSQCVKGFWRDSN